MSTRLKSGSGVSGHGSGQDLLRTVAAGTAEVVGKPFYRALTRQLATAFGAELAFIAELVPERPGRARVLASWHAGAHTPEGTEFDVSAGACRLVESQDVVYCPSGLAREFPDDPRVAELRLDSYLAVALRGADGTHLGHLAVMSSSPLEPGEDDVAALHIFAARTAAEIERGRHEGALREREAEVASSRARVVQAADEERRRIGRDLHDGPQQSLVVLGHYLDMARKKVETAPEQAVELLEQARAHASTTGQELREIARGLHPSRLAEQGLTDALTVLGAGSPLPLRLRSLPDRRLPDALETALFYLVSEALTNAVKYAAATELTVEIEQRGQSIVAEVSDDGRGGATTEGSGTGLAGLSDRIAALGGALEVRSRPGEGTRLRATIPLGPWRSGREPFLEFGYEDDGGLGERLIRQILAGEKTASVSLAREWELEGGLPQIGGTLAVIDHAGRRRGAVEVQRVLVVPFGGIGSDVVEAESAGQSSVDDWRDTQRGFYEGCRDEIAMLLGEPGWKLTEEEPMVITWFELAASS